MTGKNDEGCISGEDDKIHEMEREWIYNQLVGGLIPLFDKSGAATEEVDELKCHIAKFLELMHVQKLDVPFIAMYRKEEILSLLKDPNQPEADIKHDPNQKPMLKWRKVLWTIQDLDQKWLLLQKRKSELQSCYKKRFEDETQRVHDETRRSLNEQLFDSITKSLKEADSEREVDYIESKFNFNFPLGGLALDEAGLWKVAGKFGYNSEQFGLQNSVEKMRMDEMEDAKETPEEMASAFTCATYNPPQDVLEGARHMAAVQISCEPWVRKHLFSIFMDNAVVSTSPTSDGSVAIGSFHQFAEVKWLRNKPLSMFEDAQWLLIQKAEEEKLLKVTIKPPKEVLDKILSDLNKYYLSDGVSKSDQLWNKQRNLILFDALYNHLVPSTEKEVRSLLRCRARTWLLWEFGKLLWDKVSVAPFQRKLNDVNSDDEAAPRIMACCWGPGEPATTFVMLDSSGEILDVLHAGSLNLHGQSDNEQERTKMDQQQVENFMEDHRPHVLVVGAANMSCVQLNLDIFPIILKMSEGREVYLDCVYGDESLPLCMKIPASLLNNFLLKKNPLAMVATLCGQGREILSWKLTPLEKFLNPDDKYGMIEQVMVDVTNQVGFDINLASSHDWLFAPLQFISGLGPGKAASLQRSLAQTTGVISTREDLLKSQGIEREGFINAIGFLRVRRSGLASSKMAFEHVREKPHLLRAVDVHEYAEQKNRLNKIETLDDIRLELIEGFQDRRRLYEKPSQDDIFYMIISGGSEESLCEGRTVRVTVREVLPHAAFCDLDAGLSGVLSKEDYTDDLGDSDSLIDRLDVDAILTCRIKSIDTASFRVQLTCTDRRGDRFENFHAVDPYYYDSTERGKFLKDELLNFKPRMIVHPHSRFWNISAGEAKEFLSDKDPGESLIRPSSRGPSFLILTLKVYDGIYADKDIVEGGKEDRDTTRL
ncbi:hypothetical protein BUALT_Bualt01G0151200 [Buddleja alternifolia]|uniref:S1 motif domain-containing protein n=1 Tax=Buddleja alternifolia TaxID=168488 RepID=A0AAV6Y7B4_9LAMI|nr:hypothetical protein BUALT_Bualt01G0151200 [Buddleja alternifolia]